MLQVTENIRLLSTQTGAPHNWRLPHAVLNKNWRSTIWIFSSFSNKHFDRTKVCTTRVFRPSCHQRRRPPLHSSHIRYSLMPFKVEMAERDIPSTPCHADIYSAPNYYSITISVSEREKYRFHVQRKISPKVSLLHVSNIFGTCFRRIQ